MVAQQPSGLRALARRLRPWWRVLLRGALLVLPTLALIPLGLAWLWERGLMLEWLVACAVGVFLAVAAAGLWRAELPAFAARTAGPDASPGERDARERLARIVETAEAKDLDGAEAAQALAERVIREVAAAFHPGERSPTLRATVPELLLVVERTSADLRRRLLTEFPIVRDVSFDILERGQGLMLWADRLTAVYRVGRFVLNPLNALVAEAQRTVTNVATSGMAAQGRRRVAQIMASELGDAAILLYSGRARLDAAELREASELDRTAPSAPFLAGEPLRAVLVGQVNAGKSSLVNALSGAARVLAAPGMHTAGAQEFEVAHAVHGPLILTDLPGLKGGGEVDVEAMVSGDLILWPVAMHRADRQADMEALAALRAWSDRNRRRTPPPIVFVPTHMDRLEPVSEWAPPYDVAEGRRLKEAAANDALVAIRADLAWPGARWAPAMLASGREPWGVDAVRSAIAEARSEAEASRLGRLMEGRGILARVADLGRSLQGGVKVASGELSRGVPATLAKMLPGR